mgnify:CR=1 FL=1
MDACAISSLLRTLPVFYYKTSQVHTMIRKNSLLCKLNRIKTSSRSLFDTYMQRFQPHLETCPICGSAGNCHIHGYYERSIIDLKAEKKTKEELCILRVFCESCGHAHSILPDLIIPYSSYSLFFILHVLGQYFAHISSWLFSYRRKLLHMHSNCKAELRRTNKNPQLRQLYDRNKEWLYQPNQLA